MSEDRQRNYEMALAHFIVSRDVERSRRFYTDVLGGRTIRAGEPSYVALANSWIIINVGGGPTDDKPTVTLVPPNHLDQTTAFLNIRVSDIQAVYADWTARGAEFLTPPKAHETELRCYLRDPDGHLIEVGQTTLPGGWAQIPRGALTPTIIAERAARNLGSTHRVRARPATSKLAPRAW